MIYVVKNDLDVKYVEKLVSEYKEKFGMNILCDDHIKHLGLWLHDQVMIRHFAVSDNSDANWESVRSSRDHYT